MRICVTYPFVSGFRRPLTHNPLAAKDAPSRAGVRIAVLHSCLHGQALAGGHQVRRPRAAVTANVRTIGLILDFPPQMRTFNSFVCDQILVVLVRILQSPTSQADLASEYP